MEGKIKFLTFPSFKSGVGLDIKLLRSRGFIGCEDGDNGSGR